MFSKLKRLKKPDPEKEQALRDQIEEYGGLEKNDMKAMILAALLTIMPVAIILFFLIVLFAFFFV